MNKDLITDKVWNYRKSIGFVILLFLVIIMILTAYSAQKKSDSALKGQSAVVDALAMANSRIEKLGGVPVATPTKELQVPIEKSSGLSGPPGPVGSTGPKLSTTEAVAAVKTVCSSSPFPCEQPVRLSQLVTAVSRCIDFGPCQKPRNGIDAPTITPEQVLSGVAVYCNQRIDKCVGNTGASGEPGPPGPLGSSGINGVNGIDGTNGVNGTNGVDAPTIIDIACSGLLISGSTFTFTFSNGVTLNFTCTTPTPSPTPSPKSS